MEDLSSSGRVRMADEENDEQDNTALPWVTQKALKAAREERDMMACIAADRAAEEAALKAELEEGGERKDVGVVVRKEEDKKEKKGKKDKKAKKDKKGKKDKKSKKEKKEKKKAAASSSSSSGLSDPRVRPHVGVRNSDHGSTIMAVQNFS